ncbi:phosphoethanolamine transferase [Photobacterium sp. 1_MG-2023]|uniref:phosphoethanolamine transferase n=1 Tax=Photobacterium sp. 1_MG-2023 TaxID=3062646 RepID=UPI0026E198E8|nr:phosphoethanolamine--lipid A transferase [Photobacterium sp. 1_MG-2023]MDO6705090.1 phosphoethanolamine--lipid A transferase [Photobacterium sp. 1_MG-2023]
MLKISHFSVPRIPVTLTGLVIILSVYFGTVMNYPVLKKIFMLSADVSNSGFPWTAPVLLICAFLILFSAIAWPYLLKPVMCLLLLSSAAALYAEVNFNVLFDTTMMESVFETNASEISFYMNPASLLYFVGFGGVPCLLLCMVKIVPHRSWMVAICARMAVLIVAIAGIGLIAATHYKDYASVGRNNHYLNKMIIPAQVYSGYRYLEKKYLSRPLAYQFQGEDARVLPARNGKPTLMVVVLGETARAMNFAYNGYPRNTNPYTENLGLISFRDVSSCGTYTALSVPCMFSSLTRTQYNEPRAKTQDNVLDVMQHAGVDVLWVDNDGGDKGVAKHLPYRTVNPDLKNQACNGTTCFDEAMLHDAQTFIDGEVRNKILVLHTIGSHGPTYWQRYPEEQAPFQPACNRSDLENCTDQQIRNVYDNTLVYTDSILAKVIQQLIHVDDTYNVMLTYISDHGESLGEGGFYLHGAPYAIAPREQTQVPWLLWLPDNDARQKGLDAHCLRQKAQQASLTHDAFFHSLLGLYGVQTDIKDPALDVTQSCKISA